MDEEDLRFRTRLVSVYCHLTDNQALRLASKHNLATTVHHEMTTSDKVSVITSLITCLSKQCYNIIMQVHICRSLRYRMGNADITKDQVPSINIVEWRSRCADILMEKVSACNVQSCIPVTLTNPYSHSVEIPRKPPLWHVWSAWESVLYVRWRQDQRAELS